MKKSSFTLSLFFFQVFTSLGMIMELEPHPNLRVYMNSVYIENPMGTHSHRYGTSVVFKYPLQLGFLENHIAAGFNSHIDPDYKKKSKKMNVYENFYSFTPFLEVNFVYFFRYSMLFGPGVLLSTNEYKILGEKEYRKEYAPLATAGFGIDYAITKQWEIGWQILGQYRFQDEKYDWRHGFGLIYNI